MFRRTLPAVACLAALAACGGGGGHAGAGKSTAKSAPVGRTAATLTFDNGAAYDLTSGLGSIWVAESLQGENSGWQLAQIDAQRNAVSGAPIPIGTEAPTAIAGSRGGVLVLNSTGLQRLAGTGLAFAPTPVCGQGTGGTLAADDAGNAWYVDASQSSEANQGNGCDELSRLDPATGATTSRWSVPSSGSAALAAGDGQAWVLGGGRISRAYAQGGQLQVVSSVPETDQTTIGIGDGVGWWTTPQPDGPLLLTRVDDRTLKPLGTTPMSGSDRLEQGLGFVGSKSATGAGRAWVVFYDDQAAELAAFDLRTGLQAGTPVPLPSSPAAYANAQLTFAFGSVWLAQVDGGLIRVDPSPCCTDLSAPAWAVSTTGAGAAQPGGCSQFCLNAGPQGGPSGCIGTECKPCPQNGCVSILASSARVSGNVVRVQVACHAPTACVGALLLLPRGSGFGPHGDNLPRSHWVAGSDLTVPPMSTALVEVGLTNLGNRLVSQPGGYTADVDVVLRDYAEVGPPPPSQRTVLLRR